MERYKSKYFKIEELVHPSILEKYGESSWKILDEDILKVADRIREYVNESTYVNTYAWGNNYKNSGVRVDYGCSLSAHRYGMALDLKFKATPLKDVLEYIMQNQEEFYSLGLRRIESLAHTSHDDGITGWLHIDTVDKKGYENKIYVFNP